MNHGPDGTGPVRPGPVTDSPDGLHGPDADEPDLRRLLHSAVEDIEPRGDTLEHLRRAIPARRARKRQAVVGMAAAALFVGTAIPALVHVSNSGGADPNTAMAGQTSQAQGGTGQGKDKGTAGKDGGKDTGSATAKPGKEPDKGAGKDRKDGHPAGTPGGAGPSASASAGIPPCSPGRLGSASGTVNAPDSAGVVSGTFRVVNVSGTACTVSGPGSVVTAAQGAADPAKVVAVRHTAGDQAATPLPDPSLEVTSLVLQPGAAYEEKFAFVPSETCPVTGGDSTDGGSGTGGPSPDPSPSQDAGATGGSTDTGTGTGAVSPGATAQLVTEGGTAEGSVAVTHTAQDGAPSATAVVPGACAGTVYYTGLLAGQ
ncbi:hypothetical protein [Streptomyces sp. WELS2]|uniref:hypothetical protein n=1 Tax=Streptomyces sp. WELS2 TaxID=2749435 RepID=UPI0015F0C0B0|nr:hypothetical protein [Streptomyces sp. WELS2]